LSLRFVLFQCIAGPALVAVITLNSNGMPAIWCLFSLELMLMSLIPWLRAGLTRPGGWSRAVA
jgi:hypothetical protein